LAGTAEHEHAPEREYDAAALRVAERVRSSLDLYAVLQATVDELGQAIGVSRSFVQLAPGQNGVSRLLEWNRGDVSPLALAPPTPEARRVFETGEPLVIENVDDTDTEDEAIATYLRSAGSASSITLPVGWQGRVVAAIGFQESEPRTWHEDALPLLHRVDTQIAAAIAQAELFEQQRTALRRLEALARMRDEVISTVSHELRTPLTSIAGFVQTLRLASR
jgi:two-component system, OmpR family, phosphate regulon sensor histidine kinase PhoR